jgi:hypothetical protein
MNCVYNGMRNPNRVETFRKLLERFPAQSFLETCRLFEMVRSFLAQSMIKKYVLVTLDFVISSFLFQACIPTNLCLADHFSMK